MYDPQEHGTIRCPGPVPKDSDHSISWGAEPVFKDSYHRLTGLDHKEREQKIIPLRSSIRRGFQDGGM